MSKAKRKHLLQKQVRRLSHRLARLKHENNKFSRRRLFLFLGGIGLGIALYYVAHPGIGWATMTATLVAFNIVAFFHRRVRRSIRRHKIWIALKNVQLARMNLDWEKIPEPVSTPADAEHAFAIDLDIIGKYSLHHLLDTSISRGGSQLLLEWLLNPAPGLETISERQTIVRELQPMARFRDKLSLAFHLVSNEPLNGRKLLGYLARQHVPPTFSRVLWSAAFLAFMNLILFVLNALQILPAYWMVSLATYGLLYFWNQRYADSLLDASVFISEELQKLKAILLFLEKYRYGHHQSLRKLCEPFFLSDRRPSAELKRITALGFAVGLRMNHMFRLVLNLAVPWDFLLVKLLGRTEQQLKDKLEDWLATLVQLEALNALAGFAYLNPETTFPEIHRREGQSLSVAAIGHPLLKDEVRRCNDFTFNSIGNVALITGSNMSGKSTFLKTLGINLVLAYAGGSVIASKMSTPLVRLFSCIRINDSITDGFSLFYAEVRRLKMLLAALQNGDDLPLFFLIDEIFKGTNNRERLIGSRSFIRALAGKNGLGAISTHDLELTNLAESIPHITNYHFREEVLNGKMVFDYQIHPGPCPSTNALKIMKMEGLPID